MVSIPKFRHVPDRYVTTAASRHYLDRHGPAAFDITKGERVCAFVEQYVRPTRGFGADEPVRLLDWQRHDFFIPLFSWVHPDTGHRRYRDACLFMGRQNGKSLLCSALLLYMLVADGEAGPTCVALACDGEQTRVVYDEVLNSVNADPKLKAALHAKPSTYEIEYPARNGRLKGLTGGPGWGKLGRPPHCAVFDEFCFWKSYKPYVAIKTGKGSRNQPIHLTVSTSGTDRTTPGYEMWKYGQAVLDGLDDPTFFPLVYTAGEADDIHAEATWRKANPSLGHYLDLEELRTASQRAKVSKVEELQFRQYKLNQWTTSVNQHLDLDAFHDCKVDAYPDLTGLPAYVFIDTSTTFDLSSVVAVIPHAGRVYVEHHSWCSSEGVRKRNASANLVKYDTFEAEKTLTVHAGNCIDLSDLRSYVRKLAKKYQVKAIGIDPSHNASDTMLSLQAEGLPVVKWGSGPLYFNTPMLRLAEMVMDRKLAHRGDTLLNWQAQNLEAKKDHDGKLKPVKPSEDAKIDSMICLLGCVGLMVNGEATPPPTTPYQHRGILFVG